MKKLFCLILFLFPLILVAQEKLDYSNYIWSQTLNENFEFKGIPGGCYKYALKLYVKLRDKTDCFLLFYNWKCEQNIGSHVLVAYQVDNKYFIVDNLSPPQIVFGTNYYSWVIQYDKKAREVTNIRIER